MATMDRIAMFCHKVAMHSLTLHGATRTSPCANELVGSMSRTLNPTFTTAPPSIWSPFTLSYATTMWRLIARGNAFRARWTGCVMAGKR